MAKLTYVTGDATQPQGEGNKIIAHVCNDVGAWGAGFVLAVSRRWREPEADYRAWHKDGMCSLGMVQFARVEPDIIVANMIAQRSVGGTTRDPAIRYDYLGACLGKVGTHAIAWRASVHMPRIGCGLAGGSWDMVEPIIQRTLVDRGVDVTVYDLPDR